MSSESLGGSYECGELYPIVARIQDSVQLAAARVHLLRHLILAEAFRSHRLLQLPRNDSLDGCRRRPPPAFPAPAGSPRTTNQRIPFSQPRRISLARLLAVSNSGLGVFSVFFTNPCSNTNRPSRITKITRAIRPPLIRDRISWRPPPSGRVSGMPTGHPNSTVAMSVPMVRRLASSRSRSHCRTGSLPPAVA